MSRAILTLWQTSLLRRGQPTVIDEVASGLSYYDHTFLLELPRLYGDLEDGLAASDPGWNNTELPSFIRMGSWIGGDRDGNPFVNAEVLRQAIEMQSKRVVDFYLDELHLLGAELSLDRARVSISAQLQELVGRSPDASPRRAAEPYRQAVVGIYARLVATARGLGQVVLPRHAVTEAQPYAAAAELRADLDVLYRSLFANGSALIARGRLRALRRAVEVFGFHLASVDLRQNSQVHERTLAELFKSGAGADYAQMPEQARTELLLAELATARPLDLPVRDLFAGDGGRARHPAHGGGCPSALRQGHRPQLRHLDDHDRLRHFGSGAAAERGRVAAAGRRQARRQHRAAVRDDRRSAQLRRGDGRAPRHPRLCAAPAQPRAACRRSCSAIPTATRTAAF